MKRVAIIGANSYIARNLIAFLSETGEDCELALYDYAPEHVDGRGNYKSIRVTEQNGFDDVDFGCDLIYDFVGKTGTFAGFLDFEPYLNVNELGLLNLLRAYVKQNSAAKIIFPSTRLVYRGASGALKENAEKETKTVYAVNKLACEGYLSAYANAFGVRYCVFRICVPYGTLIKGASSYGTAEFMLGKAQKGEKIELYGGGVQRRTLTHMSDLCRALWEGGLSSHCENDVFNVGGEDYSLKEMADRIAELYGVKVEPTEFPETAAKIESGNTVFDDQKLREAIGPYLKMRFVDWIEGNWQEDSELHTEHP